MLLHVTVFLAAVFSHAPVLGYYAASRGGYHRGSLNQGTPSRCSSSHKPCRLKVDIRQLTTGYFVHSSEAYTCSCNLPMRCSSNWEDRSRVVSRSLISTTYNMTLSMMFCSHVEPRDTCLDGETPLMVSGYLDIPNDLESYNCTCPDNDPLQLHERRMENYKYYHTYLCDSHKNVCGTNDRCMTIESDVSNYHCKCPGSTQCRTLSPWLPTTERLEGYCS